jgi:hypothetical protein
VDLLWMCIACICITWNRNSLSPKTNNSVLATCCPFCMGKTAAKAEFYQRWTTQWRRKWAITRRPAVSKGHVNPCKGASEVYFIHRESLVERA